MKFYKNQLINPENFRLPAFSISPFSTKWLEILDANQNKKINCTDYFTERFGRHEVAINGKTAIATALSKYILEKEDEVWIITTTGNLYISSCVTNEIDKFCKWSRTYSDKTKIILVIHEFGMIYPNVRELLNYNLPIIEDMAMSMFSENIQGDAGRIGDFTVYSFPKFYPIQFGGLLQYNNNNFHIDKAELPFESYLQKNIFLFDNTLEVIKRKRKENHCYFEEKLDKLGLKTRFDVGLLDVPSVYMFTTDKLNLPELKVFMQRNGVEASVFYGENTFFIPVHQELGETGLNYITTLIEYFVNENS